MDLHHGVIGVPAAHQHVLQQTLEPHSLGFDAVALNNVPLKELLM